MKLKKEYLINIIIGFLLIVFLVVIDQVTKLIVFNHKDELTTYIPVIKGFIAVAYHENTGAAFGIFEGQKVFLFIVTFVALGVFGFLMKNFNLKKYPFYSMSLVLMIGGLFGNFIDRVFRPGVIDFVKTLFVDFAVFNFADMCLTCGVILMAIDIIFGFSGELWKK